MRGAARAYRGATGSNILGHGGWSLLPLKDAIA
jgi:hypothetical protein